MNAIVKTLCQACSKPMPDKRPDSWCEQCSTQVELDIIYGDDDGFDLTCDRCGGDGVVEYADSPDVWGEDCPSEMDHLVTCPACYGRGFIGDVSEPQTSAA